MNKPVANLPKPEADLETTKPICGIIMPIAGNDLYEASHWQRVRLMLNEAIEEAGFIPKMVSDADEVSVIHGSIVQNIYDNPIVVCDVSSRNPNVMFELGMRLAFDKPTIIIKDHKTDYSFDTQVIEHIPYRADLRYDDVRVFQEKLSGKIKATMAKKEEDSKYSPFLRHFQHLVPQKLGSQEVPFDNFVLARLDRIQEQLADLRRYDQNIVLSHGRLVPSEEELIGTITTMVNGLLSKSHGKLSKAGIKNTLIPVLQRDYPMFGYELLERTFEKVWADSRPPEMWFKKPE